MNNYRGGGIKTSIFLFSILLFISLLLFLFIQNIYIDSKNEATSSLTNANSCIDISFEIQEFGYNSQGIFQAKILNKPGSIPIKTIGIANKGIIETINVLINPGQIKEISSQNQISGITEIYPEVCVNYAKMINVQ